MKLMHATRSFGAVLALTGLGLFATSCGDDEDDGGTSGTGGSSGSATGGTTSGSAGKATGGTLTGGSAGASGSAGSGAAPTGGSGGTPNGGSSGMSGAAGTGAGMAGASGAGAGGAGAGGMAGAGAGGKAGAGGMAGAGAAGMAGGGAGGMAGAAGAGAGGMAGAAGAGAGGMAGAGGAGAGGAGAGGAGAGGMAGVGGAAGGGGQGGMAPVVLFDFEDGAQGWGGSSATQSAEQYVDGLNSLKLTYAALDSAQAFWNRGGADRNGVQFWPGTVLTFRAYLPVGWDTSGGTFFQVIGQANNYAIFDSTGNSARTPMPGGWTTWTYTIPETFPGGFQTLGFQIGDNAMGATIPAGSIYLDSITATPGTGTPGCARATPAGLHDFETAWTIGENQPYQVAGALNPQMDPSVGNQISIAHSGTQPFMGTGSLAVTFTALPVPTGMPNDLETKRIVFIRNPNVYCGQTMTFRVFMPTGSEGLTYQVFAQYDNFNGFSGTGGQTVTRAMYNTTTFTIPTTVGPGGIQRVGVEFIYTGSAPYTGVVYIDQVTW